MTSKLITGDRYWSDIATIASVMERWPEGTIVVHGDAAGADTIADMCAEELGFQRKPYPYPRKLGPQGGPIRNATMLSENPDVDEVVAFHDDILGTSRGTRDMVKKALAKGVPVRLFTTKGEVEVPHELHPAT